MFSFSSLKTPLQPIRRWSSRPVLRYVCNERHTARMPPLPPLCPRLLLLLLFRNNNRSSSSSLPDHRFFATPPSPSSIGVSTNSPAIGQRSQRTAGAAAALAGGGGCVLLQLFLRIHPPHHRRPEVKPSASSAWGEKRNRTAAASRQAEREFCVSPYSLYTHSRFPSP